MVNDLLNQSNGTTVPVDIGVDGNLEGNFHTEQCETEGSKVFLPSHKNCSLFYDCNNKESSACPHGMWFDPNYVGDTFCQFPEVICAADNNICECAEKYPPPPPDPLMESQVFCLNDNRFHLMPSRVNCGRYFICHNNMKYRMECRQGLHYNDKTEMCDYPEVVNCRVSLFWIYKKWLPQINEFSLDSRSRLPNCGYQIFAGPNPMWSFLLLRAWLQDETSLSVLSHLGCKFKFV